MSKQEQVPVTRYARGVKVTIQHLVGQDADHALLAAHNQAFTATLADAQENLAPSMHSWVIPWLGSAAVEYAYGDPRFAALYLPFPMPPLQQDFNFDPTDLGTLTAGNYRVSLSEISLSLDQSANPFGVVGPYSTSTPGRLTACDMNRYSMTLRLLERTPTLVANNNDVREVLRIEIDGVEAFGVGAPGTALSRTNPLCIPGLDIPFKPFSVYVWEVSCPGLHDPAGVPGVATVEQLALVSLNLTATILSPLTPRDQYTDFAGSEGLQNIPTAHNGARTTTADIPIAPPVANATVTGADIQSVLHQFDRALRHRAGIGYGHSFGALGNDMQSADQALQAMLVNDSHYCMIAIPLWSGQKWESIRMSDFYPALPIVPADRLNYPQLPYLVADGTGTTQDRRVIPLPEGFVLHHAFAVWNGYSPPSSDARPKFGGTSHFPSSANYQQKVGIILNSGWRADDYKFQQCAYLEWTGAAGSYSPYLLDTYTVEPLITDGYRLLQIPLVYPDASWDEHSWFASGTPFFMGKGNTNTAARQPCGVMPAAFGGGAFGPPATLGRENVLEVRWSKTMMPIAPPDPAEDPDDVIVGQGGEWVILIGRQTLSA